ncbi:MAG: cupredoxin domain-containing protein [Thermoleophilia bacterium]
MRRRRVLAAGILGAAGLAAAAPVAAQVHPGPAAAPPAREVGISDGGFTPSQVVVAPGQPVMWTNGGTRLHNVKAVDRTFESANINVGGSFTFTAPQAAGRIDYYCGLHRFMQGTIVVSALTLSGPAAVAVGNQAALTGEAPGVAAGTPVVVEVRAAGAWSELARTSVGADGAFSTTTPSLFATSALRARIGEDISPAVRVPVVARLSVRRAGRRALRVTVVPPREGAARLERLNLDTYRWGGAGRLRIGPSGTAVMRVPGPGVYRFRMLPGGGLAGSVSAALGVR